MPTIHTDGSITPDGGTRFGGPDRIGLAPLVPPNAPPSWGHLLWKELYSRPWLPNLDLATEAEWLAGDFANRVRAGSCACRSHWRDYLKEVPPDLRSRSSYFVWLTGAHNRVNRRKGVPEWTFAEAASLWLPVNPLQRNVPNPAQYPRMPE